MSRWVRIVVAWLRSQLFRALYALRVGGASFQQGGFDAYWRTGS